MNLDNKKNIINCDCGKMIHKKYIKIHLASNNHKTKLNKKVGRPKLTPDFLQEFNKLYIIS